MPQQDDGVHRLKDILTEEVSLVDRAANKRRFLLVKRDGEMAELKPNGRGGFTRVSKADPPEAEETDAEKAKGKPFPGAAKPFGKPAEGDEEKAKKAAEDEEKAKKSADDEEEKRKEAAKADTTGAALAAQLADHVEAMSDLVEEMSEMEDEEPSDVHMKKAMAAHKGMGNALEKCMKKAPAEKRDTRAQTFRKAMDTLQSLLGQLTDSPAKMKEHEAEPGDPTVAPKGWSPTNPSAVPSGAAGTAGGVTKSDVEKLLTKIEELKTISKAQASKISKLESGVAPSNAISVEKNARREVQKDVSWPLDMARPFDPSSVAKGESFLDD